MGGKNQTNTKQNWERYQRNSGRQRDCISSLFLNYRELKGLTFRNQIYQSTWKSCKEVQFSTSVTAAAEAKVRCWKEPLTYGCFSQGTETIHMKHISPGSVSQLFLPKAWGGKTDKHKGLVSAPILLISNIHCLENCQEGLVCERGKWAHLSAHTARKNHRAVSQDLCLQHFISQHTHPWRVTVPFTHNPQGSRPDIFTRKSPL